MQNSLIAIFFLCLFVVFAEGGQTVDHGENMTWTDYKTKFGKSYPTQASDDAHKAEFLHTQKLIQEHNAKHLRGEKSYTLGLNHHSDLLPNEKNHKGYRSHSKDVHGNGKSKRQTDNSLCLAWGTLFDGTAIDLPGAVDWRQFGLVTPVKYQGQCGSCFIFSATGALEGQFALKTGTLTPLSEQNMVDCMYTGDNPYRNACNGGDPYSVFWYVNITGGIDTEASYPYKATNQTCSYSKTNSAGPIKGCVQIAANNETQLQYAVSASGPISICIDANTTGFEHYSSGVMDDAASCALNAIDHCVLIVGFGTDNSTGTDYWIIKNSWGTSWGEQGYIRVARGMNCLGLAHEPRYPMV